MRPQYCVLPTRLSRLESRRLCTRYLRLLGGFPLEGEAGFPFVE